jgi:3-deoxy-7-phosphoheptulonate synthase
MMQSHMQAGRQDLITAKALEYGASITDGCVGWEESRAVLDELAEAVRKRRVKAEAEAE